ncbi:nitrate- and nitrite sensing domain-containing protein [Streptomyces sp. ME02-8801-2C]|uniref:sensor histidine kinase n=1 Tax=Streptomyces sp. ME02-8801-2C TaxID=3028680 RepID=UPI0029B55E6D|nr:nitrate- and nitrite sensing domain-containing protein [Streptomyces sp. ME02-8801-2C]MDX3454658.1 nitrate- and nitrite sensing domain-containing protein [Streptomyces sp. ME02-8801-2C]
MALNARTAQQPQDRAPKRQLSVRTMLLVLALVPCLALVALGTMDSVHLYGDYGTVHDRNEEGKRFGTPLVTVYFNLQEERRLSAAVLADPKADRGELRRQRELTDRSVRSLDALGAAPSALEEADQKVTRELKKLQGYRDSVDRRSTYQQQTFDAYTGVIASTMELLEDFSDVGFGETAVLTRPALDAQWGQEMISREDAIITAGVASGRLTGEQRFLVAEMIGSQEHIYSDKVVPQLPDTRAEAYRTVLTGDDWKRKTAVEQSLLNTGDAGGTGGTGHTDAAGPTAVSAGLGKQWRQSIAGITPQLVEAGNTYSGDLRAATEEELDGLMTNMIVNSTVSTASVVLVLVLSLRLTGTLRRRIFGLRDDALEFQELLPDIVERLRKGEKVDADAELPEIGQGDDELGQLGQALNQARTSALDTAAREVELYRGFERLLQRIARRTQLLIGMQLKRLGEMQRRHEDPDVLEGLFDLDHLAARLRRYEENLVILGNGTPQRRWRRPVLLLDILRSAQGEVQDYRRIRIDTDGETWLSERAVGPMVHLLAELMENAVSFSRPPTPVEVTASQVGRGVAIEIEDRGMGMDPEQYAEANALMAAPPRMDVMSRADDARLGLYVVARLAANLNLQVELRPSSFGGTRVVVLVPADLISAGRPGRAGAVAGGQGTAGRQLVSGGPVPSHGRRGSGGPVPSSGSGSGRRRAPGVSITGGHAVSDGAVAGGPVPSSGSVPGGRRIPGASITRGHTVSDGAVAGGAGSGGPDSGAQPVSGGQPVPGRPVAGEPTPGASRSRREPRSGRAESPLPEVSSGAVSERRALRGATARPGSRPYAEPGKPTGSPGNPGNTGSTIGSARNPATTGNPRNPATAGDSRTPSNAANPRNTSEPEAYSRPLIGPWIAPAPPVTSPATSPGRPQSRTQAPGSAQVAATNPNPLPRRVRQASLVNELREVPSAAPAPPAAPSHAGAQPPLPRRSGARSGATVGAFQRQSKAARLRSDGDRQSTQQPTHPSPGADRPRKEDGR